MNLEFKLDQSEEYYRKLLLLDKIKKQQLEIQQKQYIFNQKYCWDILLNESKHLFYCLGYCLNHQKRCRELEPYILQSPPDTLSYVACFIKKRWPEGEPTILEDSSSSYWYARDIIKGRWPEAENVISKNLSYSALYMYKVLDIGMLDFLGDPTLVENETLRASIHKYLQNEKWI